MSAETKELIRQLVEEAWNARDPDAFDRFCAPSYVHRDPNNSAVRDLQGLKVWASQLFTAFPDGKYTITDLVDIDDKVVKRVAFRGRHLGELVGTPPTGKEVEFTVTSVYRIADGKVVECEFRYDNLGVLVQLGLLTPPGAPA